MPRTVVEIMISAWEIECCAPPPVIGAESSWQLEFIAAADDRAREDIWTVTHHDDRSVLLDRDGFEAAWNRPAAAPPPPGIHTLRGYLNGTAHATVPRIVTAVTGRVQRVRVVSRQLERDPQQKQSSRRVPGTLATRDVRESPSVFDSDPTDPRRDDIGVLIDLAL
jgi:hypothetical protein